MKISLAIALGFLLLAILSTVILESGITGRDESRKNACFGWAMLFCCYGVCVGVISAAFCYFFHFREWVAFAIAVPLGIPLLLLAAWIGES